jgi:uncharacterized protein (DUF4415 family)
VTTKRFIVRPSRRQLANLPDSTDSRAPSRPSLGADFWAPAVPLYPSRNRRLVRLRLDPEVLAWFGTSREDPREGVNAVLRAYVESRKSGRS